MVIAIGDLDRWVNLTPSSTLKLVGDDPRKIRLDVNAQEKARLFLTDAAGEIRFLCTVTGRDRVEFSIGGDIGISTPDDGVFISTPELDETHFEYEGEEIYTRIAQRAARNYDLELLMAKQAENFERRMYQMAGDIERRAIERYEVERVLSSPSPAQTAPVQSEPPEDEGAPAGSPS